MNKTLVVDSSEHRTELCDLAAKYRADKGPYSLKSVNCGHRKGYTAVYEMLFSPMRHRHVNFLELGLFQGDSARMFTDYFRDIDYYGIDQKEEYIQHCQALNLPRTHYYQASVDDRSELSWVIQSMSTTFDIVLDDSSHQVPDQRIIIQAAAPFIRSGGLLIIEDLERAWPEDIYAPIQDFITANFVFETFIVCHHVNRQCWDNDKIWVGVRA